MRVAILGPGAVGGYLAAALWKAGVDVTCVAREPTAQRITADGLRVRSTVLGHLVARPKAASELRDAVDLLLVATKATGLASALERVRAGVSPETAVVPLLNGIEHMAPLYERFGKVAAGTIRIESLIGQDGAIEQTSPFVKIDLSAGGRLDAAGLAAVAAVLAKAKVDVNVLPTDAHVLWGKLARLNAIACTTTASQLPIGATRSDPAWRALLLACLDEGASVAARDGVAIDVDANVRLIDGLPPALSTSMQRDLAAGKPIEIDAIAGAVVRAGRRHGIACPVTEDLMRRIDSMRVGVPA